MATKKTTKTTRNASDEQEETGKGIATRKQGTAAATTKGGHNDALPATIPDMEQFGGAGLENTDRDSFAIPFLAIIQKTSPQVDRDSDLYIKGAEAGDLLLTSTGELFKDEDGVDVIFCGFRRTFLRWAPMDDGGGFKGELPVEEVAVMRARNKIIEEDGRLFADNGDIVQDTRIHYVIVVREDGTFTPAVMSIKSTQIKKSKMLLTQIQSYIAKNSAGKSFTPPSFGHVFHVETVAESNDKGSWRGWKLSRTGFVEDAEVFAAAVDFHKLSTTEGVKVNYEQEAAVNGRPSDNEDDDGQI